MALGDFLSLIPGGNGRNLQKYSNAYVFANGSVLAQEASVTLEKKSNSQPIHTLGAGFAGMSQGSRLIEVTIENAVPTSDFELNPEQELRQGTPIEIGVVAAGRQCIFKGFVTDIILAHTVNESAKLTMKLLCRFAPFE